MAAKKQKFIKVNSSKPSSKVKASSGSRSSNLLHYFRAGESYTSLVLGIIVVIIASILLLSLFKTRPDTQKGTTSISTISGQSVSPTQAKSNFTAGDISQAQGFLSPDKKTYTIGNGDNLWSIAVKIYGDGYKWVDIAKANNITTPGVINVGNKLSIPTITSTPVANAITPKPVESGQTPTMKAAQSMPVIQNSQKINGTTYVTTRDDNLWIIAVRAYGDGYKWVDIAKANNLTDPNLIFSGNTIKIPR